MQNITNVHRSETSPTGYEATFYYYAPELQQVFVSGDWMFSEIHHSCRWNSARIWPHEWTKECFPHTLLGLKQTPDKLKVKDENEVIDPSKFVFDLDILRLGFYEMKKEESTGWFSCSVPLPSGTYNYRFIRSMKDNNPMMAESVPDPENMPFETKEGEQKYSQLHVPFDSERQVDDRTIEMPMDQEAGELIIEKCEAHYGPQGYHEQPLIVYLPNEYRQDREESYPVLYLTHGGSGAVSDWVTQGSLKNIMDHLIAAGKVEPTIVVMMDNEVLQWKNEKACIPNLIESILPFIEQKYNVGKDASRRAFAGFSAGGFLSFDVYANCKEFFGYYGIWSGGQRNEVDFSTPKMKASKIHLGGGRYDDAFFAFGFPLEDELNANDISFSSYWPNGGHQWSVWRKLLEDFAERVLWT